MYGIIEKLFVTSLLFKLGSTSKILNLSFFGLLNSLGFETMATSSHMNDGFIILIDAIYYYVRGESMM